jgi:hypothetical protein
MLPAIVTLCFGDRFGIEDAPGTGAAWTSAVRLVTRLGLVMAGLVDPADGAGPVGVLLIALGAGVRPV